MDEGARVMSRSCGYTSAGAGPVSLGLVVTMLALLLTCRGQCRGDMTNIHFTLVHTHAGYAPFLKNHESNHESTDCRHPTGLCYNQPISQHHLIKGHINCDPHTTSTIMQMNSGFVILFLGQKGCESSPEVSLMKFIAMLRFPSSSLAIFSCILTFISVYLTSTVKGKQKLRGLLEHNEREENIQIWSRKKRYALLNKLKNKEIFSIFLKDRCQS